MIAWIYTLIPAATIAVLEGRTFPGLLKPENNDVPIPPHATPHNASGSVQKSGNNHYQNIRKYHQRVIVELAGHSRRGLIAFAATGAIAAGTGIVVLFIDLPFPVMVILGIISLTSLVLFFVSARARFSRHQTKPPGFPGPEINVLAPVSSGQPEPSAVVGLDLPGSSQPKSGYALSTYWVVKPYASVSVERGAGNSGLTYTVTEPSITPKEKTILREMYSRLRDVILYDETDDAVARHIDREQIMPIIRHLEPDIHEDRIDILYYYLKRDLSGYGPLDILMRDPALEDISCSGKDLPVFVFDRAFGSLPTSVVFSETELNQFVLKLAQKANKQVSLSNPMIDATLPDGARVQITYSDVVSTKGSSFTIRKFRAEPMTPLDLINLGTFNAEILAFLWLVIEHHKSLIIAGGTASGKTSTMNAISLFIPQNSKIVSLEDTREIQLPHKNWLPTQTRELNISGVKGDDIDLFSLLKASMRQRPEYIIVGEVRGKEAQTLFQAMNTGHATLSTIHAGSVQEAINRLTHDPINVPPVMFTALDLVIIQSISTFGNSRVRRCISIQEIEVNKSGEICSVPLFEWEAGTGTFRRVNDHSRVLTEIAYTRGWSGEKVKEALKKREEFFFWALSVNPPDIYDLANAIHDLVD
jgi:flagellar protein FlaI